MALQLDWPPSNLDSRLEVERPRLVRLCLKLTGDVQAAEDLAQETLVAAWRNIHQLRDFQRFSPWLSGIARNVCRHWLRTSHREHAWLVRSGHDGDLTTRWLEDEPPDDADIQVELEQRELVALLDRALALLPAETRTVLIQRYVEEAPHAEIAARLGVSESAVKMRLHRGRLALRRVLVTDLREELAPYGLAIPEADGWQATHIWCPLCGQHKLHGRFDRGLPKLSFRCPCCSPPHRALVETGGDWLAGFKVYKPALSRLLAGLHDYYRGNNLEGTVPCPRCTRRLRLQLGVPPAWPQYHGDGDGIYAWCHACGIGPGVERWWSLTLSLPAVHQFWRAHPRMHVLPAREVEAGGQSAVVTGFASMTGSAQIEVVASKVWCDVLSVHETLGR